MFVMVLTQNHKAMEPALPIDFYTHKMDRMDPELVKALREGLTSTVPSFGAGSDDHPHENYSRVSVFLRKVYQKHHS